MRLSLVPAVVMFILSLAACDPAMMTPMPASEPVATVPAAVVAAPAAIGFTAILNAGRARAGQPPATLDARMTAAAQAQLDDMIRNDFFSHQGSDGSTIATRLARAGIGSCQQGENIAFGSMGDSGLYDMWFGSAGHRANMMMPGPVIYGLAQGGGKYVLTVSQNC